MNVPDRAEMRQSEGSQLSEAPSFSLGSVLQPHPRHLSPAHFEGAPGHRPCQQLPTLRQSAPCTEQQELFSSPASPPPFVLVTIPQRGHPWPTTHYAEKETSHNAECSPEVMKQGRGRGRVKAG